MSLLDDQNAIRMAYNFTGRQMRDMRNEIGFSQKDLARAMCCGEQAVSDWERGRRRIAPYIARLFLFVCEMHKIDCLQQRLADLSMQGE